MIFRPVTLALAVRPNDLDSLGHVNNATVLEYLEAGRWAWLSDHGLRRAGRIVPVVSRIEIDYRREIPLTELAVTAALVEDPVYLDPDAFSFRAVFHQTVQFAHATDELAAEARIQVAFLDTDARTLETVQAFLRQAGAAPGAASGQRQELEDD